MKLKNYNGGKLGNGTYQNIINHVPPHSMYVAPFAGYDGVFQKMRRAPISIINDVDLKIINHWKKADIIKDCIVCENYQQGSLFVEPQERPVVILSNRNGLSIIAKFKDAADCFIYCDPPYMMNTRRSKKRLYTFDVFEEQWHVEFLTQCLASTTNLMVSHYENDLYNDMLKGWTTHRFNSMTRKGLREEIIYYNYPKPEILHDFQYLGKNFRERERIKRKVLRHENRMNNLPALERAAILSSILAQHKTTVTRLINF